MEILSNSYGYQWAHHYALCVVQTFSQSSKTKKIIFLKNILQLRDHEPNFCEIKSNLLKWQSF